MASLQKNVASQNFTFCMVSASTGAADASATVTVKVVKDNGAQASGGGTITNVGNGQYNYAPTQAETNATDVGFLLTATGDIPVNIDFHTDLTDASGNLQVDVTKINAVSTSSVTTINANQGTTQPINFTGTGASALVKTDVTDIATVAVSTSTAQLGVNVVNIGGSAVTLDANNLLEVDVQDWHGSAVGALPTNFSSLSIDSNGNVSTSSNIKKNTASSGFTFLMTDSTNHNPLTGLTVTSTRSIDGAAFASTTNSATEVANGTYTINLSAADVNGNHIMLRFTATGADDLNVAIITQP